MVLPKERSPAVRVSPHLLTIYGPQKSGKSFWTTRLPNALTLDFEGGTETHEAMSVQIKSLSDLTNVANALMEEKKKDFTYDFLIIDTLDRFIELLEIRLVREFNARQDFLQEQNPDKIYQKVQSISEIEYGKGYDLVRLEVRKWIKFFKSVSPHVIFIAHLKRTLIGETTVMVDETSLDLTGKLRSMILSDSDATALVKQAGPATHLNFVAKAGSSAGSRLPYLHGKKFFLEPGNPECGWLQIYPDYDKQAILELHPEKFVFHEED